METDFGVCKGLVVFVWWGCGFFREERLRVFNFESQLLCYFVRNEGFECGQ